jgi:hypothetical protein
MKDRIAIITTGEPIESDTWIYYYPEEKMFGNRYNEYSLIDLIEVISDLDYNEFPENTFIDYENLEKAINDIYEKGDE